MELYCGQASYLTNLQDTLIEALAKTLKRISLICEFKNRMPKSIHD